jgi:hypothetical protein
MESLPMPLKSTSALAALLLAASVTVHAADFDQNKATEESRKIAQEFMQKLGGTLKQQLQSGGPEAAIATCKQVAPALAAEYSTAGRVVKRVSLKPRNQALGTPDDWEKQKLESFDHTLSDGKPISSMEVSAVTEDAGGRWFRYLKAIPTLPMCLQCHGSTERIPEGVKAILAKDYPGDQATGYSAGAVRGAVSIKLKLD